MRLLPPDSKINFHDVDKAQTEILNKNLRNFMHILSNFLFTRYYGLLEKLETLHADPSKAGSKPFHYDGDHERRRKEQLVSFLF